MGGSRRPTVDETFLDLQSNATKQNNRRNAAKDIAPKVQSQAVTKNVKQELKKPLVKKEIKQEKQESYKDSASKRTAKAEEKAKPRSNFIQPGQKPLVLPQVFNPLAGGLGGMPFPGMLGGPINHSLISYQYQIALLNQIRQMNAQKAKTGQSGQKPPTTSKVLPLTLTGQKRTATVSNGPLNLPDLIKSKSTKTSSNVKPQIHSSVWINPQKLTPSSAEEKSHTQSSPSEKNETRTRQLEQDDLTPKQYISESNKRQKTKCESGKRQTETRNEPLRHHDVQINTPLDEGIVQRVYETDTHFRMVLKPSQSEQSKSGSNKTSEI